MFGVKYCRFENNIGTMVATIVRAALDLVLGSALLVGVFSTLIAVTLCACPLLVCCGGLTGIEEMFGDESEKGAQSLIKLHSQERLCTNENNTVFTSNHDHLRQCSLNESHSK